MSIIGRARAKVKTARTIYAKCQAEAKVRKTARDIRQREKEEEEQSKMVAEAKHINERAARREKTNKLKEDIKQAKQRKQVAYKGSPRQKTQIVFSRLTVGQKKPPRLPRRKAPRITPKTPRLRR